MMKEEVFYLLVKSIGCLMILFSCCGMAVQYGLGLHEYINRLFQIKQIIEIIQTELKYSAYPLGEIFAKIADTVPDSYGTYFSEMSTQMEENEGKQFSELWEMTMDKLAKEKHLKWEHRKLLLDLGPLLNDRNVFQIITSIQTFIERMDVAIEKEQMELGQKKRIYHCVWIFAGILLVILLL